MANTFNLYEEEEEDFLLDDDESTLSAVDDSQFLLGEDGQPTDTGPSGYTSDIRFSKELFKERQGRGGKATIEAVEDFTGFTAPEVIKNTLDALQKEGEAGTAGYQPDYPGYVTENPVLPWTGEQVGQQSFENAVLYGGGLLAQFAKRFNIPILAGTSVVTFNSIHDEVRNELAELNGKTVDQLTAQEKSDAFFTALQNTALEIANPFYNKKTKKFTGEGGNFTKQVEDFVNTAKKEGLAKTASEFGKTTARLGAGESATETLEQLNVMRVSDPGIDYATTEEGKAKLASSAVGGAGGGMTFGAPTSYREATDVNRTIKEGTKYLEEVNRQNLLKSGEQYQESINIDPELELDKSFDITPKQYKIPESTPKGTISNLAGLAGEKLLGRSTNIFQDMFKRAETGKDVHLIQNELFSMFGDVETGSGIRQETPSFNVLKHQKLDEYASDFARVYQKWSKGIGEFGGVNPTIDAYIKSRLENKNVPNTLKDVRKMLSGRQLRELDSDIDSLRKIYNKVHKDLSNILGESGLTFGYTKNYLTRGIDTKAIENNKQEFIDELVNKVGVLPKGMSEESITIEDKYKEAERIYNDILNGKDPAIMSSEQIRATRDRKGRTREGFEKHRDLKWDNLSDKFRNQSAMQSMQDYLFRAATRAASAKKFGANRAEKLTSAVDESLKRGLMTNDEAQRVWDMYDAEHNVYRRPTNERERAGQQASRVLSSATAASLLGLATISSITEPAWIPARVGLANMLKAAPAVAGHALKGIRRSLYTGTGKQSPQSFGRDLLNLMGMAINPKVNERVEMLMAGDVSPFMTTFFRTPGGLFLTQYTNFVRVWTSVAGLKMIQDQAKKVNRLKGRKKAALVRELKENGMTLNDFKQLIREGRGTIDIMNDEFLNRRFIKENGAEVSVRDLLVPWLRKITTDVALEPHVGNRPLWMSNPNLQLLAQLKSFPILFANTIMKRTYKQINPKNCTPQIVGGIGAIGSAATAIALGALATAIKDDIRGVDDPDRGLVDVVSSIGVPYLNVESFQQLAMPAGLSVLDNWTFQAFGGDGFVDETAENLLDIVLRSTLGAIFAEGISE